MAWHNATPVWGIVDCDQIMTVSNGTIITLNQVIMGVKTQQDFKSPLFLGVDTQPDGSVIVTCNKSFKEESEAFLSHLATYFEQIFGVEVFTHEYKESMATFTYCPTKLCAVEVTAQETLSCGGSSIATHDSTNYLNGMVSQLN